MKTNTLKKVLSIVIIGIILAVVATTCILAFVQKSLYNPINEINEEVDGYKRLSVYKDVHQNSFDNNTNTSEEAKTAIKDVNKLLDEMTKDSILSLMLQSTSSFEPSIVVSNAGDVRKSICHAEDTVSIMLNYIDEEQTLYWDGEPYTNSQASDPTKPVTYTKIIMPVTNSDKFEECIIYLADNDYKSSYQIKFLAHQGDLYEYIIGTKCHPIPSAQN